MPHCVIEYAKDIETCISPVELMSAVVTGAQQSKLFEADHIKTRTLAYDNYLVGLSEKYFIHVSLKILSGRTITQKAMLSDIVLKQLNACALSNVAITVEIIDMERDCYAKAVS